MPSVCCIHKCPNKLKKGTKLKWFRLPAICKAKKKYEISKERQNLWIAAINKKHVDVKGARICSDHFITGKKADLFDKLNPDWVPSINLGYNKPIQKNIQQSLARYNRSENRKALLESNPLLVKIEENANNDTFNEIEMNEIPHNKNTSNGIHPSLIHLEVTLLTHQATQTDDIFIDEINIEENRQQNLENYRIRKLQKKITELEVKLIQSKDQITKMRMGLESFKNNDKKTNYFTGLSNFITLETIFTAIEPNLPDCLTKNLNKFQILILTLLKLRLDLPFTFLGYFFGISTQTASTKFHECILILHAELNTFISWPSKEVRSYYTPKHFKDTFDDRLAVIIDCFEIRVEKPGQHLARAATFSSYKSTTTLKYLIGIAPSGAIIYISDAFGGRSSDKFATENSKLLNNIVEGDIVLSDRGFLIQQAVEAKGGNLQMPTFRNGKLQLDPFAIEDTKNLANVRIHVERAIGLLRQKYLIVYSEQPITSISKKFEENKLYYDAIVCTCCALTNLSPSIIKYDYDAFENED